jgi:Na+-transporting NADH:ubiquinone oxidoreductase subunit NqrC
VEAVTVVAVAVVDVGMVEVVVAIVVVVTFVEAVVVALVVVAVVDELQDAKAIDATRRKLNSAQMIPFFMHTSLYFTIHPIFYVSICKRQETNFKLLQIY